MALSCDTKPHFTTIADFVSTMDKEITRLFREVLLVCYDLGLTGKEMFAIDGCKLPSNASRQWSGTKADFEKKAAKMEKAIDNIIRKHREEDLSKTEANVKESEDKFVETLSNRISKIREWLKDNDDKPGKTGPRGNRSFFGRKTSSLTRACGIASARQANAYTAKSKLMQK